MNLSRYFKCYFRNLVDFLAWEGESIPFKISMVAAHTPTEGLLAASKQLNTEPTTHEQENSQPIMF